MFTGIIQDIGRVIELMPSKTSLGLKIASSLPYKNGSSNGDSIAVNGICLTMTNLTADSFCADIAPSTFEKTNIRSIKIGHELNLELALRASSFMGGHFVQGHIQSVGKLKSLKPISDCHVLEVCLPEHLLKYCVTEGSITLDGTTLTISAMVGDIIEVNIIPHTWNNTIISQYIPGQEINIEVDFIAKYMEKWLSPWMKANHNPGPKTFHD